MTSGGNFGYHFGPQRWSIAEKHRKMALKLGKAAAKIAAGLKGCETSRSAAGVKALCDMAMKELGHGLHPTQDIPSHQEGGTSVIDGMGHFASTPTRHVTGQNFPPNVHRPDLPYHFPADVDRARKMSLKYVKPFLLIPCNPCVERL